MRITKNIIATAIVTYAIGSFAYLGVNYHYQSKLDDKLVDNLNAISEQVDNFSHLRQLWKKLSDNQIDMRIIHQGNKDYMIYSEHDGKSVVSLILKDDKNKLSLEYLNKRFNLLED